MTYVSLDPFSGLFVESFDTRPSPDNYRRCRAIVASGRAFVLVVFKNFPQTSPHLALHLSPHPVHVVGVEPVLDALRSFVAGCQPPDRKILHLKRNDKEREREREREAGIGRRGKDMRRC